MSWHQSSLKLGAVVTVLKTLFATLDPGSGSRSAQILVARIVGALATFRLWKTRLHSPLGAMQETDDADEDFEAEDLDQGLA